ncbi:MAG TPA: hypothetical protein VH677_01625 [Nitrososphaera sp.]|jgi:hypothetical protein
MDTWLEVRACQNAAKELEYETVLRIPALAEAMKAVEKASLDMAKKGGGMWDYSRKLEPRELDDMLTLFEGAQERDDGRSTARSVDLSYYGRCYTLTLFAFKSQ